MGVLKPLQHEDLIDMIAPTELEIRLNRAWFRWVASCT